MKMNVGKGGKGQKCEREVGKKKGWRGDGKGEKKKAQDRFPSNKS